MAQDKIQIFNKGLNKNFNAASQPEGTYFDLLDMIQSSQDGDNYALINEKGNAEIVNFPTGCQVIGHDVLEDEIILFLVNSTETSSNVIEFTITGVDNGFFHGITDIVEITSIPSGTITDPAATNQGNGVPGTATTNEEYRDHIVDRINDTAVFQVAGYVASPVGSDRVRVYSTSETSISSINIGHAGSVNLAIISAYVGFSKIGVIDKTDTYTSIIDNPELGFNINNQIETESRIRFDGHRMTYPTDNLNPPRAFDLDDPPTNDFNAITSLFPQFKVPVVEFNAINETGGSLDVGSYQFIARYVKEDLDESHFGFSSPIIPIVEENRSVGRDNYDGAPIDTNTQKQIIIDITNIDTTGNYKFIEVAVVRYPGSDLEDTVPTIEVFDQQEITSSTMPFIYSGPSGTDVIITLTKAITQTLNYTRAKCVQQKNDFLFLSNLAADFDQTQIQAIANDIKVDYVIEEIIQSPDFNDYKGEEQTFNKKSYQREEVYSLGFGLILTNGSFTNDFHIPGLTQILNNTVPDRYDSLTTSTGVGNTTGPLGTFVSTKKYPTGLGYPTGNVRHHLMPTLAMEPHFKNGAGNTGVIRVMGLEISNVIIPNALQSQVIGYFITRERRNKRENKSIVAQGLAQTFVKFSGTDYLDSQSENVQIINPNQGYYTNGFFFGHSKLEDGTRVFLKGGSPGSGFMSDVSGSASVKNLVSFFGPDTILKGKNDSTVRVAATDFSAIKPALGLRGDIERTRPGLLDGIKNKYNEKKLVGFNRGTHGVQHMYCRYDEHYDVTGSEQQILKSAFVSPSNTEGVGTLFSSLGFGTPFTGSEILSAYDSQGLLAMSLGSISLNQQSHIEAHIILKHNTDSSIPVNVINGDSTTLPHLGGKSDRYLYNLVNFIGDQYGAVTSGEYTYVNHNLDPRDTTLTCFNGDTFISRFTFKNCNMAELESNPYGNKNESEDLNRNRDFGNTGYEMRALADFWVESVINCDYRHVDPVTPVPYFPNTPTKSSGQSSISGVSGVRDFVQAHPNVGSPGDEGVLDVDPSLGQSTDYNFLYSKEDVVRVFFPLPIGYKAIGEFPTRTIYSEKVVQGEQVDNYRIFKALNFKDIPKDTGPINDTFVWKDILYLHTSNSLWKTSVNERTMFTTTEGEAVDTGTGGIFDKPEVQVMTSKGGYAGTQSQWAGINTPYGRFFPDLIQKKIFQFNGELKEVSALGLWKFLLENMEITDTDVGDPTNKDNPANPLNGGYVAGYDFKNKRYVISKKVLAPPRSGFGQSSTIKLGRDESFQLDLPDNQDNQGVTSVINSDLFVIEATSTSSPNYLVFSNFILPTITDLDTGFVIYVCNEFDDGATDLSIDVKTPFVNTSNVGVLIQRLAFGECGSFTVQSDGTWLFAAIDKANIVFTETFDNRLTLSYSPVTETWISRHSWHPNILITKGDRFFSISNTASIGNYGLWEHGEGAYGKFYQNAVSASELIFVFNIGSNVIKTFDRLILHTQASSDVTGIFDNTETFDTIQVYNEKQNSGTVTLVVAEGSNVVHRVDKFQVEGPEDAVIDPLLNIFDSTNLDQTLKFKGRIRSKYMFVKLTYSNANDLRLVLNAIEVTFRRSYD